MIQLPWAFLPWLFEEIALHPLHPGVPRIVVKAHPRGTATKVWLEPPLYVCLDLLFIGELVAVLYVPLSNTPETVDIVVEAVDNRSNGFAHFRTLQQPPQEGEPLVQYVEVALKAEIRLFHPGIHHTTPS